MTIKYLNLWISVIIVLLLINVIILLHRYLNRQRRNRFSITFEGIGLPSYRSSLAAINKELSRVRRVKRPLSVVVMHLNNFQKNMLSVDPNLMALLVQLEFLLYGHIIRDALRDIDIASYDSVNGQYVIVLPETTRDQAAELVNRLKKMFGETISEQINFRINEYPTDGLIIDDLVQVPQLTGRSPMQVAQ